MLVKDIKVYQKMKNKGWSSIEKTLQNEKKKSYYNNKKLFSFRNSGFFRTGLA